MAGSLRKPGSSHSSWDEHASRPLLNWSIFGWVLATLTGVLFFTNTQISPDTEIAFFDSWHNARSTLSAVFALLLASVIAAYLFSIPALVVQRMLKSRLELLYRRSWNVPTVRVFILKNISVGILVVSHLAGVLLSFGSAPLYSRGSGIEPTFFASLSRFVYERFFPAESKGKEIWQSAIEVPGTKAFVLFFPASVLSTPELLRRVRKEVGEPIHVFLDSPTFPAEVFQLLNGGGLREKYLSPLLLPENLAEVGGEDISGAKEEALQLPVYSKLAPEFRGLEMLLEERPLKEDDPYFSTSAAIRKRLALSQPHLFLFFRFSIMGRIFDEWKWDELFADDSLELAAFLKGITKNTTSAIKMAQFSELENISPEIMNPLAPERWRAVAGLSEKQQLVSRVDALLAIGASLLKKQAHTALFVLPYPDRGLSTPLTWGYIFPSSTIQQDIAAKQRSWLTMRDVADLLRRVTREQNAVAQQQTKLKCEAIYFDFSSIGKQSKVDESRSELSLWKFFDINEDGSFSVLPQLNFFFNAQREYGAFCPLEPAPLLVRFLTHSSTQPVFKSEISPASNLRDSLFLAQDKGESRTAKDARNRKAPERRVVRKQTAPSPKLPLKVELYKVLQRDFGDEEIVRVSSDELAQFMGQYEVELLPIFETVSRGQLAWE